MSISVSMSASLCAEIYKQVPSSWDHYWDHGSVVCAHRAIGDEDTLTFMGSKLLIDWMRDAAAAAAWWDSDIGFVPLGFWIGMNGVLDEVRSVIKLPLTVQGHSLGGARSRVAVGKMLARGLPVQRLCVFGSPKAGMANMTRIYDKCRLERDSFRNMNDPVPLTPPTTDLLPWEHTEPWKAFAQHAAPEDLEPLRDHHMALYGAGADLYTKTLEEVARAAGPKA